jgi:hypothetical protein
MLFSSQFKISKKAADNWFDPILDHDTRLFIDPFLVFKLGTGPFKTAHVDLIAFFDRVFVVAAESGGDRHHPSYKKLHSMLMFPEVDELRLGYAERGTKGAGTAKGFARIIAAAVLQSIALGITKVEHFEQIGIFNEGIGPDRISDITANILKGHLVAYTQAVAQRHNVPMEEFAIGHVGFDYTHLIWNDQLVDLPKNSFTGAGILLVPKLFLRQLPTIRVEKFWDFAWEEKEQELRHDLNYEVKSKVNRKGIIALAKEKLFWVRDYVKRVAEKLVPVPYDLERDPDGLYQWDQAACAFASSYQISLAATTPGEFDTVVVRILEQFKLFIEEHGGYKLLWDGGRGKPEEASQLLFMGIARNHCQANNVDVSREADIGRGPVDFKFSSGFEDRALIEVKLARNTRFWNGLEKQLPTYMKAEGVQRGYFVVVCYTTKERQKRWKEIDRRVADVRAATSYDLRAVLVDAIPGKPSASKL